MKKLFIFILLFFSFIISYATEDFQSTWDITIQSKLELKKNYYYRLLKDKLTKKLNDNYCLNIKKLDKLLTGKIDYFMQGRTLEELNLDDLDTLAKYYAFKEVLKSEDKFSSMSWDDESAVLTSFPKEKISQTTGFITFFDLIEKSENFKSIYNGLKQCNYSISDKSISLYKETDSSTPTIYWDLHYIYYHGSKTYVNLYISFWYHEGYTVIEQIDLTQDSYLLAN